MLNQLSTTGYRRSAQTRWRRAQPFTDERDGRESINQEFRFVYEFFAQEYSHRDRFLGNLLELQEVGGPLAMNQAERELAEADDTGATPTAIGEVGGFVLHPDVPSAGTRRHHQNHIHANLGHDGPPKRQGEIWTNREVVEARKYGYER